MDFVSDSVTNKYKDIYCIDAQSFVVLGEMNDALG